MKKIIWIFLAVLFGSAVLAVLLGRPFPFLFRSGKTFLLLLLVALTPVFLHLNKKR